MMTIHGYQVSEKIYESANSLVYRGRRETDNQPVVLKVLKQAYPPPEKIAWFKREYEVTRGLSLPGVVEAYSLETVQHRWVMVLEDFGGESLVRLGVAGTFALAEFLNLAIRVTDILGQIHRQNIMHKDVNPSNIVLNPATGQLKMIDFGISTVLSRENPTFRNPNVLEGTLAYMSPEQTGRMNRAMDYRTDFYSLGATFYELLTGQLPFPTTDRLELVHGHIARQPTPPHELEPDIPQPVSDIVIKLVAKDAEDRYQSAHGLQTDLEECLRQWQATGRIDPFPLGRHDVSDRFQIPQQLYGREAEIATLLAGFERVSTPPPSPPVGGMKGRGEMMLVSGRPGIGKTALVQEVYKPITRQRGYFISGKFDQFQRNIPYAALIQAFRSLMRQLLTESEPQIATWREKLLAALGPNGQVVIDVIPDVELIIGPQPAVPELPPTETQNRFNLVFQNFIRVFTRPEHPLVIFLDDLQWADAASLNLLKLLMTAPDSHYLFFIGAYRDNEVSPAHPLMLTVDEIKKDGAVVNHISLSPLDLVHVNQFTADTLNCTPERARSLAELVRAKTGGNPFFVIEFLKSLYAEQLLEFDYQRAGWQWNLGQIPAQDLTDNVVELMGGKVQKLSPETQQVLKLAACIGNQFDLQTLAVVHEQSPRETAADLWEAVVEGLALPLGEAYKLAELDVEGLADELTVEYRFAHDRVQQAIYSLIPEADKQAVHRQVGQLLLQNTPPEEREERIFDIVNQLNRGVKDLTGFENLSGLRDELAELNLMAGRKAKASAAYGPAFNYLQVGLGLLGEDNWQRQYDLALALHVEAAEAAYLSGDFEQMEQLAQAVLQRARTLLDKVKVYEVQIEACSAQSKPLEAVQIGLPVLKLLGVRLPEKPGKRHILLGLVETKLTLAGKRIEDLINLPEMTDPHKLAAMRILSSVVAAAYMAVPELFPLIAFKIVNLSVKHGNTSESAAVYAAYGVVLCGVVGDIDSGYRFGQLALNLLDRLNARENKAQTYVAVNNFIRHWKEHARETLQPFLEGYQSGLETGDLEYAAYSAYNHCHHLFYVGQELAGLEREMASYSEAISQLKQEPAFHRNELYRQVVLNLLGRAKDPCRLSGEAYDEEKMLPLHIEANDTSTIRRIYFYRLFLYYLFQQHPQAVENAAMTEKYLGGTTPTYVLPLFHFYDSLARLALFPDALKLEQKRILKKVAANQKKMKKWAHHAPMNHRHKFYLVEAERARVLGHDGEAREYYDQAIALARENEYLNEEALANELAARFYLAKGLDTLGRAYLREAHYAYLRWGARAKVQALEEEFPQWLAKAALAPPLEKRITTTPTTPTGDAGERLDLSTVMKASQAISGEILLDRLLARLMKIVIENAGAQTGYLILEEAGQLVIEAEGVADRDRDKGGIRVLQSMPVESSSDLSAAIVNYVARTQESVVLNDAAHEGLFTTDPYVIANQPQSILCTPLIHQGQLSGILYLENNLTTGAFTPDRLEVLQLLSAQVAISIENARLYANLGASEEKYRTLFEDSRDTIFITAPTGQILDVNPAGLGLFGYSREEMAQVDARDLYVNPDDRSRFQQEIGQQGLVRDFEVRFRRKDGTEMDCLMTATVRQADDGTVLSYQGIIRDVTERKRAERLLADYSHTLEQKVEQRTAELAQMTREAQEARAAAEAATQAKSTFLANMSHELRTPLNAIIGFTRLVKRRSKDVLPQKQVDNLEKVLISADHLLGLINDILDLSKIEAGRVDVQPTTFRVEPLVDVCLRTVQPLVKSKQLRLVKEIEPDLPPLFTDQDKVRQILINLLSNAVKFTEAGTVTVTAQRRGEILVLAVADTGIGIPEQAIERIFEAFQQVDGSTTRQYGGTGLGLSISRHLARLLGGEVTVESTVGVGSTFTVTVPIQKSGPKG